MSNDYYEADLDYLTVDEFSAKTGICRVNVYSALNSGRLNGRKAGRKTLIPVSEAKRFLASLPAYRPGAVVGRRSEAVTA
jgi:hypothetical protein